jgi:hypothetical protein
MSLVLFHQWSFKSNSFCPLQTLKGDKVFETMKAMTTCLKMLIILQLLFTIK